MEHDVRDGLGQPSVRDTHQAYESFRTRSNPPARVRSVVADSWLRSAAAGLDADRGIPPIVIDHHELADYRAGHPLSLVYPLLYEVLGRAAVDCECVMAIGDADGKLLWVCGQPAVLRKAEAINFAEGAIWDEARAGTNAPGTALRLDAPVQIHAAEHFSRMVQPWSCAAAPIHDPVTRAILGIVDVTGGENMSSPQTLAMVRAAARMAESELARLATSRPAAPNHDDALWSPHRNTMTGHEVLRAKALGRPECTIELADRALRLSPRHSDIIVALVHSPRGLTGDQLALQVYAEDVHASTMRAEMTRLRSLVGPDVLRSRPYRLALETDCDWQTVSAHLVAGRAREAMRDYAGPLLQQSDAPVVIEVRERLERQLRSGVVSSGLSELMVAWTGSSWGAEDLAMWHRQVAALPPTSPLRANAVIEARRLELQLSR